jgi:plasmid maintenance system antidote protein VapI
VAIGAGIPADTLAQLLAARRAIDAAVDARLTRYFGMSDGFFLRLQNLYDLEEVVRREGDALDRIVPRAA